MWIKNHTKLLLLFSIIIIWQQTINAQSNKFSIGGYGEMVYQYFDYGANQNRPEGSASDSRAIMDIPRLILKFKYNLSDDILFETEIEFEHLGTGSAIELEYEEFGEYEAEIEKGGEIALEQMHLTKTFSPEFNLRIGHFVVGFGALNKAHLPTMFFTTIRPEAETAFLPSVWHETGIELFGDFSNLSYQLQLVNGLDNSGFSSENWIKNGSQKLFEEIRATNLAVVGRLDYSILKELKIGASGYFGNTSGNRPKNSDMQGIDAHVELVESHFNLKSTSLITRGTIIYGTLQNAKIVSAKIIYLSNNYSVARTPVAKAALAWSLEAGYDFWQFIDSKNDYKLYPFLRYEYYNPMQEVDEGVFAVPRYKRTIFTFGANFLPLKNLVIKADYSTRVVGEGNYNTEHTFGFGVAFSGIFFQN